jgi:hypothetical protein
VVKLIPPTHEGEFKVAIDIDDVIFDLGDTWRARYCVEFNTVPIPRNIQGKPLDDTHFNEYEEFLAWLDTVYDHCPYIPGAEEGVHELIATGYEVTFVTARSDNAAAWTEAWLANSSYADLAGLIHSSKDKREAGCHVYVDDMPKILLDVHAMGATAICHLRPWNDAARKWPSGPPFDIKVAGDWEMILKHVHESYETWLEL